MVIFGKPKNLDDYVVVKSDVAKMLHSLGFPPIYRDYDYVYFFRTKKIKEILDKQKVVEN